MSNYEQDLWQYLSGLTIGPLLQNIYGERLQAGGVRLTNDSQRLNDNYNYRERLQYNSRTTVYEQEKNHEIVGQHASENTKYDGEGKIILDPNRIFTRKQKKEIWDASKKYNQFDENTMRVDLIGCIIIKDLQRTDKVRKALGGEYEHIHSHSKGGETKTENGCILQCDVNNKKRANQIFELYRKEYVRYRKTGIMPNELRLGLENDFENTCKKFNILFEKIGTKWSPVVLAVTKGGKNIYKPYFCDKEDFYHKTYVGENAKDSLDPENRKKVEDYFNNDESSEETVSRNSADGSSAGFSDNASVSSEETVQESNKEYRERSIKEYQEKVMWVKEMIEGRGMYAKSRYVKTGHR